MTQKSPIFGIMFILFCLVVSIWAINQAKQDRDARKIREIITDATISNIASTTENLLEIDEMVVVRIGKAETKINNIDQKYSPLLNPKPIISNEPTAYCTVEQLSYGETILNCRDFLHK
jgi:hypothetical protein